MSSTLILGFGATQEQVNNAITAIPSPLRTDIVVVGDSSTSAVPAPSRFINRGEQSVGQSILNAMRSISSDTFIVIDARAAVRVETLQSMATALRTGDTGFLYSPIETGSETISFPEISIDAMPSLTAAQELWPLTCAALRRRALDQLTTIEGNSSTEAMAQIMIELAIQEESIGSSLVPLRYPIADAQSICTLSAAARARCLRRVLDGANIEEIFPHHAWSAHREESAAASYHALAAIFIRLGDMQSAMDCLALGDQFEDSPRSLALKAIIALEQGETLTAVANMVSSLQAYEVRKKENANHYVHFSPRDAAQMSSYLTAGLAALNKRDNDTAARHFAEALNNFDPFFKQHGVTMVKGPQH